MEVTCPGSTLDWPCGRIEGSDEARTPSAVGPTCEGTTQDEAEEESEDESEDESEQEEEEEDEGVLSQAKVKANGISLGAIEGHGHRGGVRLDRLVAARVLQGFDFLCIVSFLSFLSCLPVG
jgi:hypothetical protein